MSAVLEEIKTTDKANLEKARVPYDKLVVQTANDEKSVDATKAKKLIESAGKSMDQFESDVSQCQSRIKLIDGVARHEILKKKATEIEKRIKAIDGEINEVCKPLMEEQNQAAKKFRTTQRDSLALMQSAARLREGMPTWMAERRKDLLGQLNQRRPRLDYLSKTSAAQANLLTDLKDRITKIANYIATPFQKSDFESQCHRKTSIENKKHYESQAERQAKTIETERKQYKRLEAESGRLQLQISRLDLLAATMPWPTPDDV